jgi:hypothetical protein
MNLLSEEKLNLVSDLLSYDLIDNGVWSALLTDLAGNVLVDAQGNGHQFDKQSLASLAAGNFIAVSTLLNCFEDTELTLLFHKGKNLSIHFKKILDDFLVISIFDKNISLGFLRLKIERLESFFRSTFKNW